MTAQDLSALLPVALVFGLFGFKSLSCRRDLRRHRLAAEARIRHHPWKAADGSLLADRSTLQVRPGSEEVRYGFFALDYYSRRFLIECHGHHFLAIVASDQSTPYVKLLDPQRAALVSRGLEWSRAL